jgi:hypothetical protein
MAKVKIKRKEKQSPFKCFLCKHFFDSELINRQGERHCKIIKKDIDINSIGCEDFSKAIYFYCNKRNMQVAISACYSIRKTKQLNYGSKIHSPESYAKVYDCCHIRCEQGRTIEKTIEFLDLINGTASYIPFIREEKLPKIKIKRRIK